VNKDFTFTAERKTCSETAFKRERQFPVFKVCILVENCSVPAQEGPGTWLTWQSQATVASFS